MFTALNHSHYQGQKSGFYESFYQRANHPTQPLAFWIRYTIFSPKSKPEEAIGELWGIYFNGITGEKTALKKEIPFSSCIFDPSRLYAQVGEATLEEGNLKGTLQKGGKSILWNLSFKSNGEPFLFMPLPYYERKFPVAKSFIGYPLAQYTGTLEINGQSIEIKDWVGSQNHNWGPKHTDAYALGQISGFDNSPNSFLEVVNACMKIGPFKIPAVTPAVFRHKGHDYTFYSPLQAWKNKGSYHYFVFDFHLENKEIILDGTISAPKEAFVGLTYYNPPGDIKHCLNTKIASCELKIRYKNGSLPNEILVTKNRSLFEIVTSDLLNHGVPILV